MVLYHGSTVIVQEPKVIKNEIGRDFGFGFYTTDIRGQAVRWANRKAMIESRKAKKRIVPVINIYEWDEETARLQLKIKEFDKASMEWLDLVLSCRSDISFIHDFDIVIGKIANDNVGETVSYVLQGVMRKEDAIERLMFEKINNQIAFCSENALRSLHYKGYLEE
jgi:hypothetical protein